uniref:Uncharacterized protein n=1 Tax=Schistocephalus solidus TaxID=70667 RepID=A0A0V0JCH9_SCHSO
MKEDLRCDYRTLSPPQPGFGVSTGGDRGRKWLELLEAVLSVPGPTRPIRARNVRLKLGHVGRAWVLAVLIRGACDLRATLLTLAAAIRLAPYIDEPVFTDFFQAGLSWGRSS